MRGLDPRIHPFARSDGLPGFAAELVIGPRFARTRWRRPGNNVTRYENGGSADAPPP
ncbi:MAG: hypothetical protein WBD48_14785 [Pseudolabrys sp.]